MGSDRLDRRCEMQSFMRDLERRVRERPSARTELVIDGSGGTLSVRPNERGPCPVFIDFGAHGDVFALYVALGHEDRLDDAGSFELVSPPLSPAGCMQRASDIVDAALDGRVEIRAHMLGRWVVSRTASVQLSTGVLMTTESFVPSWMANLFEPHVISYDAYS